MAGLAKHVSLRSNKFNEIIVTLVDIDKIDPDELIASLHDHPHEPHRRHIHTNRALNHVTPYSSRYASQQEISKFKIPQQGAPADAVHQMLKDELDLDGRPNLNLARSVVHRS